MYFRIEKWHTSSERKSQFKTLTTLAQTLNITKDLC